MAEPAPRRFRVVRALLAFLFVAAVLLASATQHPWVRARIHAEVAQAIRRELGLDADIGPVSLSLPFRISGDYIRLTHPKHGLLASADELEIEPSLWSLVRGQLEIRRIVIEGARVRLRIEDGRIVNLPELQKRPSAKPMRPFAPKRIPLEELVVRRARLAVDASPVLRASLDGMNAVVRIVDGARIRLQLSVGAGQLKHELGEEKVSGALVSGLFAPDRVELDTLRLDTSLLKLRVRSVSLGLPAQHGRYRGKVQVSTDLGRLAKLPLGLDLPALTGKISVTARVDGAADRYHVWGDVHADNPTLAGFGFGILDLKVDATPDEVRLLQGSQGRITEEGGLVKLEARVGLTGEIPVEVKADVVRLEFHKLMAMLGTTDNCLVNWLLEGGFNLRGTIKPLDITGPIWAEHLAFKALTHGFRDPSSKEVIGTPPGHVSGRVAIRPDALRFENLHARLPHSDMLVTVHVGFDDKIGVTARGEHLDLSDTTGLVGMPLRGVGKFSLDVGGTYDNTTLTGELDLEDFVLDDFRIGHIRTKAVMEKGGMAVRFVDTQVRKNDSRYTIDDLFLDFSRELEIDGRARLERLALADFYHTFEIENDADFTPYQGHVRGTAQARYTFGFPDDDAKGTLRVDTSLDVLDATAHGVRFGAGRLEGSWTWKHIDEGTRGARLELAELSVHTKEGGIHARGTMDYGGALSLTVFGEELDLHDLDVARSGPMGVDGELNFVGRVRGTPWVPEAKLDVDLSSASFGERNVGDAHFEVRLTHRDDPWVQRARELDESAAPGESCVRSRKVLSVATFVSDDEPGDDTRIPPKAILVCGGGFEGKLVTDLALGLADGMPALGRVGFTKLPMAWVVPRPSPTASPVRGALTGTVDLTGGTLENPDSLLGKIDVESITFGQDQTWLESEGPVRLALTGNGASVERAHFVGQGSSVIVTGGASFAQGLATHVTGKFDLALLASLVPSVSRSSGMLDVDVNVTGKPRDPSIYGRAKLTSGSLLLRSTGQLLDKVQASLSFSEREILLEELSAQVLGGVVRVHGSAALRGQALERYELFINAKDIGYEPSSGIEVAFAADTKLVSAPGMRIPELTGTIRLERVRYKRPFSLGLTDRLTGFSQAKRATRNVYDPARDRLAFDLRVVESAPIRITNNLLNAELTIEDSERPFRIVGTDQRYGVLGTLELTRGTLTFRNTEFLIEEGTVSFVDEHRVRPRVDIHARTEFRRTADASGAHWWISMHASGETDNLKLETSSEPALAQEDIALLLTVGLTRAEAERLGTSELTQGAALEALATVTGVDREVKKALPVIDDFALTSAYSARSNRTEPQVVVGKRLSDRVRATARSGLTADSNFKTGVEWRLDDQTSVEAAYDNVQTTTSSQFGNVGVDLRWRLEFD